MTDLDSDPRSGALILPDDQYEALEEVRRSGECNMFDVACVLQELKDIDTPGAWAAMGWIEEDHDRYAQGVFNGIESESGAGPRERPGDVDE
jgi:hypothetical protein